MRMGIPIIGGGRWMGGVSYIELLARALHSQPADIRPQLFLVVTEKTLTDYIWHEPFLQCFDNVIYVGHKDEAVESVIPADSVYCLNDHELFLRIDFYFPSVSDIMGFGCYASWIPDFQHKYLGHLFSEKEINDRDEQAERVAGQAPIVVLSSRDAEKDFRTFFPDSQAKLFVLPFYSLPKDEWYTGDPGRTADKYGLPDRFILCCNQFWAHKNYRCLFEAISLLRAEGKEVHLVCTGLTEDYRNPNYFDELMSYVKSTGIELFVHILGRVSREDQIQLIRKSVLMVQPSLFEGWSTVVEDARVLGKTIVLSDLDVNKEQAPEFGVFFERTSPQDLANKIWQCYSSLKSGPLLDNEEQALRKAAELVDGYAKQIITIMNESVSYNSSISKSLSSVLVMYDDKGTDYLLSGTYKSILEQTHPFTSIRFGTIEDLTQEPEEDYVCFVEEGFIMSPRFVEAMLKAAAPGKAVVGGISRKDKQGKIFFNPYYPLAAENENYRWEGYHYPAGIFPTKQVMEWRNTGSLDISSIVKLPVGLVETSLDSFLRQKLEVCQGFSSIYIYGAGGHTLKLLESGALDGYPIRAIFDSNPKNAGTVLHSVPVCLWDKAAMDQENSVIIISSSSFENEIYTRLKSEGEFNIITLYNYLD
jgi:glycosyltransferase involved in cell wall biosynthesis